MIENNQEIFSHIYELKQVIESYNVELIVSELGPNWNWLLEPYLDDPFVGAWYADALIRMIKLGVDMEFFYSGTSDQDDGGFAMWLVDDGIVKFPVYDVKKEFAMYNQEGYSIYNSESKIEQVEVLGVGNGNVKFVTLVNKDHTGIDLNFQGRKIELLPYEVRFVKVS